MTRDCHKLKLHFYLILELTNSKHKIQYQFHDGVLCQTDIEVDRYWRHTEPHFVILQFFPLAAGKFLPKIKLICAHTVPFAHRRIKQVQPPRPRRICNKI